MQTPILHGAGMDLEPHLHISTSCQSMETYGNCVQVFTTKRIMAHQLISSMQLRHLYDPKAIAELLLLTSDSASTWQHLTSPPMPVKQYPPVTFLNLNPSIFLPFAPCLHHFFNMESFLRPFFDSMPSCAAVELALPNLLSSTFPGLGFAWIIGCKRQTRSQGQRYSHDPAPKLRMSIRHFRKLPTSNTQNTQNFSFSQRACMSLKGRKVPSDCLQHKPLPHDPTTCMSPIYFYILRLPHSCLYRANCIGEGQQGSLRSSSCPPCPSVHTALRMSERSPKCSPFGARFRLKEWRPWPLQASGTDLLCNTCK